MRVASLRRVAYGKKRGFLVEAKCGRYRARTIVEEPEVTVLDGVEHLGIEAFLEAPKSDSYFFRIEAPSTTIVFVEGKALESSRYRNYVVTRPIKLVNGAHYRVRIEVFNPLPGSRISLWISYGNIVEPAYVRCFVPASPYITVASLTDGTEVELRKVGTIAKAIARNGIAQLDVSNVKHPIGGTMIIDGAAVAEVVDAWGGDVYIVEYT